MNDIEEIEQHARRKRSSSNLKLIQRWMDDFQGGPLPHLKRLAESAEFLHEGAAEDLGALTQALNALEPLRFVAPSYAARVRALKTAMDEFAGEGAAVPRFQKRWDALEESLVEVETVMTDSGPGAEERDRAWERLLTELTGLADCLKAMSTQDVSDPGRPTTKQEN